MTIRRLLQRRLAIWLVAFLPSVGWAASVAKPSVAPISSALTTIASETRARFPWYASVQPYDVDIRSISTAISQRAQQLEFLLPVYGQVRFELQALDLSTGTPLWSGVSQQGDRISFGLDEAERSIRAHLQMRDGKHWRIERLLNSPQHFLVEVDAAKLPRGNDALPVPPRTAPPGRPTGTQSPPRSGLPPGLVLQRASLGGSLPQGLILRPSNSRSTTVEMLATEPVGAPRNASVAVTAMAASDGQSSDTVINILVVFTGEAYSRGRSVQSARRLASAASRPS